MTKLILTTVLLIAIGTTTLLGQNRMKFKHRLSQNKIHSKGFVLLNPTADGKSFDTLRIGGKNGKSKLSCIIKLDSKGNILVDFWSIPDTITKRHWIFWKKTYIDEFQGDNSFISNGTYYVNSGTSFNIDKPTTLSDGRKLIGYSTKVLCVPFNGFTFGVATIPFRWRGSEDISATEKVNAAVTSPKPDISFTGGWTLGKSVITNRSIINYSATFGAFVGLTGAEIKDGVVKTGTFLYGTGKTTKQVQTNPAMSYGAAITLARNNLGLVFVLGFDNSFGDYSKDWVYQNRPWVGIGLSANLGIF